jgi:predicted phosphatase
MQLKMIVDYMPILWVRQDRYIFEKTSAYFSIHFNIINPYAIKKNMLTYLQVYVILRKREKRLFFYA